MAIADSFPNGLAALERRELDLEIERHNAYRARYLPSQIAATEAKLISLKAEAARRGVPLP